MARVLRLYDHPESGNCYKVRLLLAHLGRPYEREYVEVLGERVRGPDFLARNPIGRIPVLVLDDGTSLYESNAILCYLGEGTPYLPADPLERARVHAWMFFEQNNHEPNIATRRYWVSLRREPEARAAQLPLWLESGARALTAMEAHLAQHDFFGPQYSLADIALFAYTHVADEGGFDLAPYPAIGRWLDRVRAQPGFAPLR